MEPEWSYRNDARIAMSNRHRRTFSVNIGSLLLMSVLAASLLGLAMLAMGVSALFKRECLRGSCGGPSRRKAKGEVISCGHCPNRAKHHRARTDGRERVAADRAPRGGACSHRDRAGAHAQRHE
jgi:hypothetical protein